MSAQAAIVRRRRPTILDASGRPIAPSRSNSGQRAYFDAAANSHLTDNHWAHASDQHINTHLSRDLPTLRKRCRYEARNNCYARGMIRTHANDLIGTGPRLQILDDDIADPNALEDLFARWLTRVDASGRMSAAQLLRMMDQEQFTAGDAFLAEVATSDRSTRREGLPRLRYQIIAAARVATPLDAAGSDRIIDGIEFDALGRPVTYHVLKSMPGADPLGFKPNDFTEIPAERMIALGDLDTPGQSRSIPRLTPALRLYADLRRYTLAVITTAERQASPSFVLHTTAPEILQSVEDPEQLAAYDEIPIDPGMMMTVPAGYEPTGLEPTQPHANYAEFKREILLEAARALNMPYNVAAGISESYNYASGRLDHQTYHRTLQVERDTVERRALDAMLAAWWYETALVSPDLDPLAPPRHRWMWPGFKHVDPVKEASAEAIRLSNGTITLADIASEAGQDWRRQVDQRAEEREYLREKGLLAEADQSIAANADEGRAAAHQPEPTR